jgi:SAM-dependent methyltransferase
LSDSPKVWHYGLVARWWAEFNHDGPEIDFFRGYIERGGGPALDAACGAGRLLLPYLRAGLDVDGCDLSADMLAYCAAAAEREGLRPRLYAQALHELDLPRTYRTIVVCGGFGLGGSRRQDQEALRRFFDHLQPGGTLLIDSTLPYQDAEEWGYWRSEGRATLSEDWPASRQRRRRTESGDEIELRGRVANLDPLDQVITREIQALLWRDGRVVHQERYTLFERLYFRNEMLDMLAAAGFADVLVLDDYSDRPASADSGLVVYVASRSSAR